MRWVGDTIDLKKKKITRAGSPIEGHQEVLDKWACLRTLAVGRGPTLGHLLWSKCFELSQNESDRYV